MFDFAWTQIGLIGIVALVLIGPKDLPIAIRTVAGLVKKARRMAGEFQTHVDEMVKDTELADIRNQISEIRNFDIKREVAKAVDTDGSLRASFHDPFQPVATPPPAPPSLTEGGSEHDTGHVAMTPRVAAPSFVPPQFVDAALARGEHGPIEHGPIVPDPDPAPLAAPSFVPPDAAAASRAL